MGMQGKHHIKETRERISQKAKERLKDKRNHPMWNRPHTKEHRRRISLAMKKEWANPNSYLNSEEHKRESRLGQIKRKKRDGYIHSPETRKKMSIKRLGKSYEEFYGTEKAKEIKRKRSLFFEGEKNPLWKGNKAGYFAIHQWIRSHKPKPKFCERCYKKEPVDVANISGKYKRDINDYEWLCRSCHLKGDFKK
jgi:hypothetical protein